MKKVYEIRMGFEAGRGTFGFYDEKKREEAFEEIATAMKEKRVARFHSESDNAEVLLDCTKTIMCFTSESNEEEEEDFDDIVNNDESSSFAPSEDVLNFFKNGNKHE